MTDGESESSEDSFVASFAFVRCDPQARLLLLLLGAECIAIGAIDVLAVELAQAGLGYGGDWVGSLTAAFGAGGVLAVWVTARMVGLARLAPALVGSLAVWSVALLGLELKVTQDPARRAEVQGKLGVAQLDLGQLEKALANLQFALQVRPDDQELADLEHGW